MQGVRRRNLLALQFDADLTHCSGELQNFVAIHPDRRQGNEVEGV